MVPFMNHLVLGGGIINLQYFVTVVTQGLGEGANTTLCEGIGGFSFYICQTGGI